MQRPKSAGASGAAYSQINAGMEVVARKNTDFSDVRGVRDAHQSAKKKQRAKSAGHFRPNLKPQWKPGHLMNRPASCSTMPSHKPRSAKPPRCATRLSEGTTRPPSSTITTIDRVSSPIRREGQEVNLEHWACALEENTEEFENFLRSPRAKEACAREGIEPDELLGAEAGFHFPPEARRYLIVQVLSTRQGVIEEMRENVRDFGKHSLVQMSLLLQQLKSKQDQFLKQEMKRRLASKRDRENWLERNEQKLQREKAMEDRNNRVANADDAAADRRRARMEAAENRRKQAMSTGAKRAEDARAKAQKEKDVRDRRMKRNMDMRAEHRRLERVKSDMKQKQQELRVERAMQQKKQFSENTRLECQHKEIQSRRHLVSHQVHREMEFAQKNMQRGLREYHVLRENRKRRYRECKTQEKIDLENAGFQLRRDMQSALVETRKKWHHERYKIDQEQHAQDVAIKNMDKPAPGKYGAPDRPRFNPKFSLGMALNRKSKEAEAYMRATDDPGPGAFGREFGPSMDFSSAHAIPAVGVRYGRDIKKGRDIRAATQLAGKDAPAPGTYDPHPEAATKIQSSPAPLMQARTETGSYNLEPGPGDYNTPSDFKSKPATNPVKIAREYRKFVASGDHHLSNLASSARIKARPWQAHGLPPSDMHRRGLTSSPTRPISDAIMNAYFKHANGQSSELSPQPAAPYGPVPTEALAVTQSPEAQKEQTTESNPVVEDTGDSFGVLYKQAANADQAEALEKLGEAEDGEQQDSGAPKPSKTA